MQDPIRKKRPIPERDEPVRSWFGADPPRSEPSANGARETGYQTVNTAYQLVDEYMRQGQKFAENLWLPLGSAGDAAREAFNAPERFMRAMGDMTMAWVEVMQEFTAGAKASERGQAHAGPFTAGHPKAKQKPENQERAQSSSPSAITVSVVASGRVEVSVQLQDHADLAGLVASELRPFTGDAPPIPEPRLSLLGERTLELQVVVPDGQPAGAYNGLLVAQQTQRPRGTINVVVGK
ncbi:MAG: hypothetical protein WDO74_13695 [Pseudomonadota bacterium]